MIQFFKKIVLLVSIITVSFSCKDNEKKEDISSVNSNYEAIDEIKWLVGNWTNITEKSQSYENWKQLNDSTLTAFSFTTVDSDTVFKENMILIQDGSEVLMSVVVPDQNDAETVTFKLISSKYGNFTVENLEHDFPSRITYSNPTKDSIHAWIEGTTQGEKRLIDFYFKRAD